MPDFKHAKITAVVSTKMPLNIVNVPTNTLGVSNDFFSKPFRFNIMVNDNDNNIRESWMAMAPGIGNGVFVLQHPVILIGNRK